MNSNLEARYQNCIQKNRLKSSKRRDLIFNFVSRLKGHFTVNDIYQALIKQDPEIGIATVYRTIRLLVECGVLEEQTFGEKKGFFEVINNASRHHDHLICLSCGRIMEFHCKFIETEKQRIAEQYQFQINSHKIEIFGLCKKCQQQYQKQPK